MSALAAAFRHVLVVDDIKAMRLILRSLLRSVGIDQISEAADGAEALEILKSHKIDLVITDLNMGPIDGIALTRQMRGPGAGFDPAVPILMVSGHTDAASVKAAIDAGVTEFLVKPVVPSDLMRRLQAILDKPKNVVQTATYLGPDRRRRQMWVRRDRRGGQT